MRARRGQPQPANHWCFNRHLNAVNLAPGNGGVDFERGKNADVGWETEVCLFCFSTGEEEEKDESIPSSVASQRWRRHDDDSEVIHEDRNDDTLSSHVNHKAHGGFWITWFKMVGKKALQRRMNFSIIQVELNKRKVAIRPMEYQNYCNPFKNGWKPFLAIISH